MNNKILKLNVSLYLILLSNPVLASLEGTGRNLTTKAMSLGKIVIGLFVVITGFYFVTGSDRAKDKAKELFIGAFFIFAASSIFSWLKGSIR